MLRCPKCSRIYQDGTQRFCSYDGGRLLSVAPNVRTSQAATNTFTTLLQKAKSQGSTKEESVPSQRYGKSEVPNQSAQNLQVSAFPTKVFAGNRVSTEDKIPGKVIKMSDVPPSQAALGDRKQNPTGRLPLTWINTKVLVGQTIKGRYLINDQIAQDEFSVAYSAEDKILVGKKVIVKVLMDDIDPNHLIGREFLEERVRLSHLKHPNIAAVLDSGELPEGKQFLICEFPDGKTLAAAILQTGQFTPARIGKIIRQIGGAVSEAHQNGVLHRDLKPEKITLFSTEYNPEHIKVADFAIVGNDSLSHQDSTLSLENFAYKSPEQLEGKSATAESDVYALGVIAFQLLTGRLPFSFSSVSDLIALQKRGLAIKPTNLRFDITAMVDEVLVKALSPEPENRYRKAREFSDALHNALNEHHWSGAKKDALIAEKVVDDDILNRSPKAEISAPILHQSSENLFHADGSDLSLQEISETNDDENSIQTAKEISKANEVKQISLPKSNVFGRTSEAKSVQASDDLAWKDRAIQQPYTSYLPKLLLYGGLLALIAGGGFAMMKLITASQQQVSDNQTEISSTPQPGLSNVKTPETAASTENASANSNTETTEISQEEKLAQEKARQDAILNAEPPPRVVQYPPNSTTFHNTTENLDDDLVKNFRGFSLYYPKPWEEVKAANERGKKNFAVFKNAPEGGFPIEQLAVTYYESSGLFTLDQERFPKLVQTLNNNLSKPGAIPNYRAISEGVINLNGRNCYEVKFQGSGEAKNGKQITIWGRAIFVPSGNLTVKSGLRLVMLASSLSPEVKGVDDVGVKGDLAAILATFEPDRE